MLNRVHICSLQEVWLVMSSYHMFMNLFPNSNFWQNWPLSHHDSYLHQGLLSLFQSHWPWSPFTVMLFLSNWCFFLQMVHNSVTVWILTYHSRCAFHIVRYSVIFQLSKIYKSLLISFILYSIKPILSNLPCHVSGGYNTSVLL